MRALACATKPHTFLAQNTAAATLAPPHAADDCFTSPTAALSGFLGSPTFQPDSSLAFGGPSAVLAAAPEPLTLSTPSYLPTAPAHRGAGTAVAACRTAAALQPAGGAPAPAALSQESGQGSEGREPLFFSNVVPPPTAAHSSLLQQMQEQEGQQQQQQPAARLAAQVAVPPVPPATFAQQQGLPTPSFAHNQHQLPFQLPPGQHGLMAPTGSLPFAAGGATMPGACSLQPSVPALQQLCGSLHSLDVPLHVWQGRPCFFSSAKTPIMLYDLASWNSSPSSFAVRFLPLAQLMSTPALADASSNPSPQPPAPKKGRGNGRRGRHRQVWQRDLVPLCT